MIMSRASFSRFAAVLLLAAVGVCLGAAASGQSLGEVARREAERRKAIKGAVPVYTNDSLHPSAPDATTTGTATSPSGAASQGSGTAASAEAQAGTPKAGGAADEPAADPRKDQEYWRKKMSDLRVQRDRNAFLMEALQGRVNSLWADFTARDDPAQRQRLFDDRQRALAEMERMKTEQAALDKQLADLEEDARRANVPPGWIR
jgi:hypothetical protein